MKQLKKTLLTLVALLAVTTGAWAQPEITTIPNGDFETWTYDGEDMPNNWNSNATSDGSLNGFYGGKQLKRSTDVRPGSSGQYSCSIWSKSTMGVINIGILTSGRIHFGAASSTSNANYIYSDRDGSNTKNNVTNPCAMPFTGKPTAVKVWVKYVQGGTGYGQYATAKFSAIIHGDADYVAYNLAEHDNDDNKALVVASAEQEIAYNNGEWEQITIPFNYTDNDVAPAYILINAYTNAYPGKGRANDYLYIDDIELEYASASSGPEVAWNKDKNSGSFTMPGGNVTVSVEYYDLATLADKGLTAAEDAAAKTEAPLAVLAENAITGGTVMYYVAPDANFSQADAIALAETAWSADIPTAETIDAAGGTCYVWYYIKGDDEHSDTDPQLLQVTVLPEPTYAVELAEGTEESDKWTVKAGTDGSFQSLPLKGVKAGTKVKLKYDGDRSMLKGVKAVKKAAAEEPVADIVWDSTNISDLMVQGTEQWYVKEDVTLCGNAEMIYATWFNYGDPTHDGIGFNTNESGGYTFVAPTGKAFTKIEMKALGDGGWHNANLGTGWAFNVDMEKQIFTVTWKGSAAASTVDLLTEANDFGGEIISYIAFTLVDAE